MEFSEYENQRKQARKTNSSENQVMAYTTATSDDGNPDSNNNMGIGGPATPRSGNSDNENHHGDNSDNFHQHQSVNECSHVPKCCSSRFRHESVVKLLGDFVAVKENLANRQKALKTHFAEDKRILDEIESKVDIAKASTSGEFIEGSDNLMDDNEFLRKLKMHDFVHPTRPARSMMEKDQGKQIPFSNSYSDSFIYVNKSVKQHDRESLKKMEDFLYKEMNLELDSYSAQKLQQIEVVESEHEDKIKNLHAQSTEYMNGIQQSDEEIKNYCQFEKKVEHLVTLFGSSYYSLRSVLLQTSQYDLPLPVYGRRKFSVHIAWEHLIRVLQADLRVATFLRYLINQRIFHLGNIAFQDDTQNALLKNLESDLKSGIQKEEQRLLQLKTMAEEDGRKLYTNFREIFDVQNSHHKKALEKIYAGFKGQLMEDAKKVSDLRTNASESNHDNVDKYERCIKETEEERQRVKDVVKNLRLKLEKDLVELKEEKEADIVKYLDRSRKATREMERLGGTSNYKDTLVLIY